MKLLKNDVGRLCLVKFDDVGRIEGMIVGIDDDRKSVNVYFFNDQKVDTLVAASQIVEKGTYVTPNGILESQVNTK